MSVKYVLKLLKHKWGGIICMLSHILVQYK